MNELISLLRQHQEDLNPPAGENLVSSLRAEVGSPLIDPIILIYRDHNGSPAPSRQLDVSLPVRLMSIDEVLRMDRDIESIWDQMAHLGRIWLFWTDDNSNYIGMYTDGPVAGWLTVLSHDSPQLTPAFRSVENFVRVLVGSRENPRVCDAATIPTDVPVVVDDPSTVEADRRLASHFRDLYHAEQDDDMRRLYAETSIVLTPVADTASIVEFLADPDMWTPEAAALLLGKRRVTSAIPALGQLAEHGHPNGDGAAIRALAAMRTSEAQRELDRLSKVLQGQKHKYLSMIHLFQPL